MDKYLFSKFSKSDPNNSTQIDTIVRTDSDGQRHIFEIRKYPIFGQAPSLEYRKIRTLEKGEALPGAVPPSTVAPPSRPRSTDPTDLLQAKNLNSAEVAILKASTTAALGRFVRGEE